MNESQGYITVATRRRKHLEMAVDLALSLRKHDATRAIAVVVDEANHSVLNRHYPNVFDSVHVVPRELAFGYAPKLYVAEVTPFSQTLFVDADCLVLRSLEELWSALRPLDFTVLGDYVTPSDEVKHHNISTRRIAERFELKTYFHASSPLFYFQRERGRDVLGKCLDLYTGPLNQLRYWRWDAACAPDEIAFGIVGSREEIGRFPQYDPIIERRDASEWKAETAPRPIFHCIFPTNPDVMDWLMRGVRARRTELGLPNHSERYWRGKAFAKRVQYAVDAALNLR